MTRSVLGLVLGQYCIELNDISWITGVFCLKIGKLSYERDQSERKNELKLSEIRLSSIEIH